MTDCIFCKISNGEISSQKVYEDEDVFAFLDMRPKAKGHTLVVPKKHSEDFLNTPNETLAMMMPKVKSIAEKILKEYNASGFNLVVNNGKSSGQEVFHLHFHIIPK